MSSVPSSLFHFVGAGRSGKTKGSAKFSLLIAELRVFGNTWPVAGMAEVE